MVAVEAADEAEVVGTGGEVGEEVGDFGAALAVGTEVVGAAEKLSLPN